MRSRHARVLVLVLLGAAVALTVEVFGLYAVTLQPLDTVSHVAAGLAIGSVAAVALRGWDATTTPDLDTVAAILVVAVAWEVVEVVLPGVAGYVALGPIDTAVDILATVAGGIVAIAIVRYRRRAR